MTPMAPMNADRSFCTGGPMRRVRECHEALFEEALSRRVIGAFFDVYNALGYGFLESVYAQALALELTARGLHVAREVSAEVRYEGEVVGAFRIDLLVEDRLVLALKATAALTAADRMQLLNYLRASDLEVGLLLHFGPRPAIKRFLATNEARAVRSDRRSSLSSASSASAPLVAARTAPTLTPPAAP
jgi:GxxExxY protein